MNSICQFGCKEIEYFGHIISNERVETDPKKTEALVSWHSPTSLKSLRGFLSLTGYYNKFIMGNVHLVAPLPNLLKKNYFSMG